MRNINRINEIISSINAFNKEGYLKSELLEEYLKLQSSVVACTFNHLHADNAELRLQNVLRHLTQLNEECDHVADEELAEFRRGCLAVCNNIIGELSGRKGEQMAFASLENLNCRNRILKNVELKSDELRSEIDAVVVTAKATFMVEVKNTKHDVLIDEAGNYYRTGESLKLDSNIGDKLNCKDILLRKALAEAGIVAEGEPINIVKLVVFTNSSIYVRNKYAHLQTCFLSQLRYIIEDYEGEDIYTESDVKRIAGAVEAARCAEAYPVEMDINQFKLDFATLMVKLEEYKARKCDDMVELDAKKQILDVQSIEYCSDKETNATNDEIDEAVYKRFVRELNLIKAGKVAAVIASTALITAGLVKKYVSK